MLALGLLSYTNIIEGSAFWGAPGYLPADDQDLAEVWISGLDISRENPRTVELPYRQF